MDKKRILFIITGLIGGGAEKALLNLLQALDKNQYEIDVLVIFENNLSEKPISDITFYTLFNSHNGFLYKLVKHTYLNLHISLLLQYVTRSKIRKKYDVIVSFLEGDSLLYHSFLFDRAKRNVSWVHTDFIENHWSERHFVGTEEYKVYQKLDGIVFVSEYAQKQFNKVFEISTDIQQYICPNIINEIEITQKAQTKISDVLKRKFTICSVGRLEDVKGYDMVIKAAVILKQKGIDVDFWIVGQGSQEGKLRALLSEFNCCDMVHFIGYKKNPYPYMMMADMFLSSSRSEGLPLVFGEAMCLGKLIVATNTIGARTMLRGGEYGKIVDITSEAIANAIIDIQKDTSLLQHYAALSLLGKRQFSSQYVLSLIKSIL